MTNAQDSFDRAEAEYESQDGIRLPNNEDIEPQGCDICGAEDGNHSSLCPDIRDGLQEYGPDPDMMRHDESEDDFERRRELQEEEQKPRDMFQFLEEIGPIIRAKELLLAQEENLS